MQKFTVLTGVAAVVPQANIDTDILMPKQFLKTIKRTGLGKYVFYDRRFDENGAERPEFALNQGAGRNAKILITGPNFGCGSSREHAPWGLADFGISCIIAPSFADIFYNNCFKNGILCIVLPQDVIDKLSAQASSGALTVNLPAQTITTPDGTVTTFDVDPDRKRNLVEGLDEIGLTLLQKDKIAAFEAKQKASQPWMYQQG
jgi:3-isopropylmalate/(R)-2-methylmalate dehydratase small subunit